MGVKLQSSISAIPASFKKSHLKFWIGAKEYDVHIPAVVTLEFPLQCNHFIDEYVFAYLVGEKYSMILRYNGTGSIFTSRDRILCMNFEFETPCYKEFYVTRGGSFIVNKEQTHSMVDLFKNGYGQYILSIVCIPISLIFEEQDNPIYLKDIEVFKSDGYPEIGLIDNQLYSFGPDGKVIYGIKGKISKANAFTVL